MTSTPSVGQHASVLAALGGRIASGKLAVGQVLTLEGIGSEYAVSRSVAREAIRVLESMGLVASRRRVGITIQPQAPLERLRPARDPLAARRGRPDRAAALALRAAPRHRAGRRGAGRRARRRQPVPGAGGRRLRHGDPRPRRATSTPTCWPTRSSTAPCSRPAATRCCARSHGVVAEVLSGRTHHGMMPAPPEPGGDRAARRGRARRTARRRPAAPSARCARSSRRPPRRSRRSRESLNRRV